VVADIHGQVHVCNPDFDVTKSWLAHTNGRVTHMKLAGAKGVLVTLGVSILSPTSILVVLLIEVSIRLAGRRSITASSLESLEYPP